MIRLMAATLLVASFSVVVDTQVPNIFTDGTPAEASEVNANFDALEAAIANLIGRKSRFGIAKAIARQTWRPESV